MDKAMTALIIMDGFGINPAHEGNAIFQQGTPHLDALMAKYPHTQLGASGMKDMGAVMKRAMSELRGKADGSLVNQIARDLLT